MPPKCLSGTLLIWCIDEIKNDVILQKGDDWSFMMANFLLVEDFEIYIDLNEDESEGNKIFHAWIDGFDNPAISGSIVGFEIPPNVL